MAAAAVKPLGPPMQPTPQKSRPIPAPREGGSSARRPGRLGPMVRILISLWIVWHFTGVFLAALSLPPTSQLVIDVAQQPPMQWYLDALYLNQGHSFFAPEVGPGHLIRFQLFDQRGQVLDRGELPSRKDHWPRLFYHRHFMLADQADFPSDVKQVRDDWQRSYLEAYGRHLLRVNENAQSVRLQRIIHWPLPREFAEQGKTMTDPESYELMMEVTQHRRDLDPEPNHQSLNWQNGRADAARRWTGAPR